MSRWFRFYDEALDNHKVQALPAEDFKAWVNILCVASRNDGRLPPAETLAFSLRMTDIATGSLIDRLLIAGLIDKVKGGAIGWVIAPHDWDKRQYKSDTSNERVKRYRQRDKTVTVTAPDTDTDTDSKKEEEPAKAAGPQSFEDDPESEFWSIAADLEKSGVAKSRMGQLARLHEGNFRALVPMAKNIAKAKNPATFIGAIIRNRKTELEPVTTPTYSPVTGEPDFVRSARSNGAAVEKHAKGWWISGSIYNHTGEQIGW